MRWFGRAAALLLALGVMVLLVLAVWNAAAQSAFVNPATFKAGLAEQNIYADMVPVVLPALLRLADAEMPVIAPDEVIAAIGEDEWRAVADELVPPQWLQAQIEGGIDQIFAWINGEVGAVSRNVFDLSALQSRLTGEPGQRAIDRMIRAAPLCTSEQVAQLHALQGGDPGRLPICQPPEELLTVTRGVLESGLANIARNLAARELSLDEAFVIVDKGAATEVVPLVVQAYRDLTGLLYLCPAGLLVLIVLVTVRSLKEFGRWVGLPLLLGGVLAVAPLPFLSIGILSGVTDALVRSAQDPEVQQFQARLMTGLLRSSFGQLTGPVLVQAALLMGAGLVLLVISSLGHSWQPAPIAAHSTPSTAGRRRTVTVPASGGDTEVDPQNTITME